jgi:prepilin-type N-terminal cleavage/methylation domain-containing protein
MTSRTGNNAFTLIEVLVASVILFAGLGAVLKAYSMAVTALDSAADVLVSTAWLRDKVAVMELQGKDGSALMSSGGEIRLEGRDYRWDVDAREQAITPDLKLLSAVIRITRFPSGTPHLLQAEWALFQDPPTPPPK